MHPSDAARRAPAFVGTTACAHRPNLGSGRRSRARGAANWLAKSEANLDSAFDESPEQDLGAIRVEQARTEEAIARFMEMSGGNPTRRLSNARRYREDSVELLARLRVDG